MLNEDDINRLITAIDDSTTGRTNHELLKSMDLEPNAFIDTYLMPKVKEAKDTLAASGVQLVILPILMAQTVMDGMLIGMELQRLQDSKGTWLTLKVDGKE